MGIARILRVGPGEMGSLDQTTKMSRTVCTIIKTTTAKRPETTLTVLEATALNETRTRPMATIVSMTTTVTPTMAMTDNMAITATMITTSGRTIISSVTNRMITTGMDRVTLTVTASQMMALKISLHDSKR